MYPQTFTTLKCLALCFYNKDVLCDHDMAVNVKKLPFIQMLTATILAGKMAGSPDL